MAATSDLNYSCVSSPRTMTSLSSKDAVTVLAPALANAALLVAAPSLGCLSIYINTITDLYKANGLPVPDLAHIHQHRSVKPDCYQEPSHDSTVDFQELEDDLSEFNVLLGQLEDYRQQVTVFNKEYYDLTSLGTTASNDRLVVSETKYLEDINRPEKMSYVGGSSDCESTNIKMDFCWANNDLEDWLDMDLPIFPSFSASPGPRSLSSISKTKAGVTTGSYVPRYVASPLLLVPSGLPGTPVRTSRPTKLRPPIRTHIGSPRIMVAKLQNKSYRVQKSSSSPLRKSTQAPQKPISPQGYSCSECKSIFTTSAARAAHFNTHNLCPRCECGFSTSQDLIVHRRIQKCTRANKFVMRIPKGWLCTRCNACFDSRDQAEQHTITKH